MVLRISEKKRMPRWYFGGVSAAVAVCITHPLDLVKVHLQTQKGEHITIHSMTRDIVQRQGIRALYNGISASVFRQLTYSTTRFAIYDYCKTVIDMSRFEVKMAVAALGGAVGGLVGAPADLVNVRMQNDIKLPVERRRNYKNAIDGLIQVFKHEGVGRLFTGSSAASFRAALLTVGQISVYDQLKTIFLQTPYFSENIATHFTCSFITGVVVTIITQPVDVLKTRLMNAKSEEFMGITDCVISTSKEGFLAFYKGTLPAAVRHIPNAVIIFIVYEQLIKNFGYIPKDK